MDSSSGFIYFQTSSEEAQTKTDTSDFLSFNDSAQETSQSNVFSPIFYSSPQNKFNRKSYPGQWSSGKKNKRWSSESSFGSPYRSFQSIYSQNGSFQAETRPWVKRQGRAEANRKRQQKQQEENADCQFEMLAKPLARTSRTSTGGSRTPSSRRGPEGFLESGGSFRDLQDSQNRDISKYMHPSFTEDPWMQLEKELEEKKRTAKNES